MKLTQYYIPTLREAPQDADIISAKLMFRAGLIRKLASGIYDWLPFGLRSLKKAEQIVREEMDRIGGLEVWLPVVQPRELWEETGRWAVYGKELLRIQDRKEADFCFAPTAEEVITDLVRRDVRSYRQLPLLLYQFGLKFRDEIRPRFGVMRAREFYMKDGYSFHVSDADAEVWYKKVYSAYCRIFARCGFKYLPVEAESGPIGGSFSHEFMVLADTGEADIASCPACGYCANVEKAGTADAPGIKPLSDGRQAGGADPFNKLEDIATPGLFTVSDVSAFLKIPKERFIKTLFFEADGEPVLVLVRGDHELNENKLRKALSCKELAKASEETYMSVAGCGVGFAGPAGIRERFKKSPKAKPLKAVLADNALKTVVNGVSGANKTDMHTININLGRDYEPDKFEDLRVACPGDSCPKCSKPLSFSKGIEVGHTFKLGTKYSVSLKTDFLDENQKSVSTVMGCYGIGISRIVAAAIEQCHDENGIVWPVPLAPFEFSLIAVETEDPLIMNAAEIIDKQINEAGMTALWDDRAERPGIKFKDADLIGLPYRIVVSSRTMKDGECEFKRRSEAKAERWKLSEVPQKLSELASLHQKAKEEAGRLDRHAAE